MEDLSKNFTHINGWGIDADPENEPTYPMKHYTGDDHKRINWERPPLQEPTVEVLHSNERPGLSAVFGTVSPPAGLSGAIRRFAFRNSESSYAHWLPLILADRINMIEGVIDDLAHGHIPNIIAERGWTAEWKYNRKATIQKLVISGAVAATFLVAMSVTRKKKKKFKLL